MNAIKKIIVSICIVVTVTAGHRLKINSAFAQRNEQKQDDTKELLDRIDFGNAYIIGQTIKSGAVYLLQRKKSEIKTMLNYREHYRREILEDFPIVDRNIQKRKSLKE